MGGSSLTVEGWLQAMALDSEWMSRGVVQHIVTE